MTSLATCIKRAGKALTRQDAEAIREIMAEGGTAQEAVDEYLTVLADERTALGAEIEAQGGVVGEGPLPGGNLTMEEIDFDPALTGELKAQEMRFAEEMVGRDWAGIVAEYQALDGTNGPENVEGGKINSVDAWRELSAEYRADRSTSAAAHEVSSAMSKKYYAERLATPPFDGPFSEYYMWTSGGTGAGKTSGLGLSQFADDSMHIFDGNLAKFPSAVKKIDQALDAGRLVDINHVSRDPIEALTNGAIFRAMRQWKAHGSGRIVPIRAHVHTHVDSATVMRELYEHYGKDQRVAFEITDNNHGKGGAKIATMNDVLVLDKEQVMEQGLAALKDIYENGHPRLDYPLASDLYYGFIEQPAPPGTGRFHSNFTDSAATPDVQGEATAQPQEVRGRAEPQGDGGRQLGVRQAELQLSLAPAIRALVGTVRANVVQSTTDIPGDAVPTDVEGLYRVGSREIFLVADNLPTTERAKKVFAHEAFGHLAMEQQPEFQDVLASVKNLLSLGNKTFADVAEQVAVRQGNLSEDNQAKEVLAYMAEQGIENGTVGRAVAAVRQMLRRMGLLDGANYSEAEIKALLVRAARDIVSSAEAKQKALAAMPVQEQVLSDPTAVEDVLYNAINEVYANGVLMDDALNLHEANSPEAAEALYRAKIAPVVSPDVIEPEALYQIAYHGTAAMFKQFDINYIGTGEGFAAYGWGLYFSSKRAIAEWYQRSVAGGFLFNYGDKSGLSGEEARMEIMAELLPELRRFTDNRQVAEDAAHNVAGAVMGMYNRHQGSGAGIRGELEQQRENYRRKAETAQRILDEAVADVSTPIWAIRTPARVIEADKVMAEGFDRAIELATQQLSAEKRAGYLMEVEVPEDEDLLNYDRLMSDQPEILNKIPEEVQDGIMAANPNLSTAIADMRGGQFYGYLGSYLQSQQGVKDTGLIDTEYRVGADKLASLYLKEQGIPGHKFTGQTSDELNYLMYDDAAVEIQKVNDRIRGDFEYSADYSLFSRLPSYAEHRAMTDMMRLRDATKRVTPNPADAAAAQLGTDPGQPAGWYWKIASEAGTRAFGQPKGSWEERYYTELGKQASQAARAAVPPPAQITEQQALFSRVNRREFLMGASAAITSAVMTPKGMAAELVKQAMAPATFDKDAWLKAPGVKTVFEKMNINGKVYNVVAVNNTAYPGWQVRATNVDTLERIIKRDIPVGDNYANALTNIKRSVITPMTQAEQQKAGPRQQIDDIADAVEEEIDRHIELQGSGLRGMRQPVFSKAPPVESPAFKAWFGDSKVVNDDGSPQVVYHGTKAEDFSAFKAKYDDALIFFTKDAAFAAQWMEGVGGLRTPPADTEPHIRQAKETERRLTTEIMGDIDSYDYNDPADLSRWEANRELIRSRMKEETGFETASRMEDVVGIRIIPTYLSIQNPFDPRRDWREIESFLLTLGRGMDQIVKNGNHKAGNWVVYEQKEVIDEIKRLGYDGIWLTENIGGEHDTIAAFSPEQIKSATGNQGTFDATNPNILFSRFIHPDAEIEAIRERRLSPALEDYTVKDRVRELVNRVRGIEWLGIKQGIVDSAASVEEYEKGIFNRVLDASESAYKSILSTRNLGSVMAAIMHRGIPMYQNGVFIPRSGRKGLIQIFEKITHHESGNLLPLWELYAAAKRASRLIGEKNPDGTSKEKNFTQDEISKALTLGIEYPEFQTAFLEWQKFNSQLLDLAIKRGVINGDEAKIWRQNDYVPFYRAMEEIEYQGGQGPQTGRSGVANVRSGIKRLTGSENPIGNVFENMVMNTAYLTDAIYRNTAMQRTAAMLDGVAMHKIPMAFEAIKFSDADLARALMKAGLIVGNGTTEADMFNDGIRQISAMTAAQKSHWSTLFRRVAPRGENVVSVLEQGKPVYYEVSDPLLMRSIAAMGAQQAGGIMNTMRFAKRVLTKAVTVDPAFMMANFLRDTLSTAVVVKGNGARQILGAMKGLRAAFNEDEEILEMMMAGAGGGGFYDHNPSDVRKMLAKKMPAGEVDSFRNSIITPRGAYRAWQKIGNASEQANRVALYKRIVAEGGSKAEAAFQARDVLNFTMAGDYNAMKFLVQTVPFLNARVQGLYRLWRGGKENPVGFAMKGGMIMAATMALLLKNQDDERYKQLPEWDKDTYWHFYVGNEHLRLPKPFEVGALFATVPERMFMLASGDDNIDTTIKRGWRMAMDTFAFNPVPQAIKPIVEQYSNRNMFTGNPILGMAHKGLKPEAQYDPWTSETMRELAKILPGWGGSPKRLESFMRGYFGAVGMYALGASDAVTRRAFGHPERPTKGIRNYPVLTRFWRDPNPRTSKYSAELYDMLGEADALYKTMNAYRKQRRVGEAAAMMKDNRGKLAARAFLHDVTKDVRKINDRIRRIQYSDMDADKKKAAIDKLNAAKIKHMSRVAKVSDIF